MSDEENCPNGCPDCNFSEKHELALAGGILRVIESYTKDNDTYPCPSCLRNSIMAIAALLHIEATKTEGNGFPGIISVDTFTDAARERILSVIDAVLDIDKLLNKRKLM